MAGWWNRIRVGLIGATVALAAGALCIVAPGAAAMRAKKIGSHLCKTVNGGKFVPIPGFPGEQIDRRLLPDISWMKRRFDIFITDGYSNDPVHAQNGEHPIGLATDIVPDFATGGTWNEIGDLAHLAEPSQNEPVMPWRWVGWNGDPGHGRGDHLHLSWSHSPTPPGQPARVVYTRFCPGDQNPPANHRHHHRHRHGATGGTSPGKGGTDGGAGGFDNGGTGAGGGGGGSATGGTTPHVGKLAPVVREDR